MSDADDNDSQLGDVVIMLVIAAAFAIGWFLARR